MSKVWASSLTGLLAESFPETRTGNTILIRLYRRFPIPLSNVKPPNTLPISFSTMKRRHLKGHQIANRQKSRSTRNQGVRNTARDPSGDQLQTADVLNQSGDNFCQVMLIRQVNE